MNKRLMIALKSTDQVLQFSASELHKYLSRIIKEGTIKQVSSFSGQAESDSIKLGLFSDFDIKSPLKNPNEFDDAYFIDVRNACGFIAGANARSVLLGAYRYLYELGFRWIRPGDDGEITPSADVFSTTVKLNDAPSYRHRGICIEGAVSYENVLEMIDWAPKLGFNSYFIQFREAFAFFDRWYSHLSNPTREPGEFSIEQSLEFVRKLEKEIKKRGLIYHAVGHGWTCEPFGIRGLSWVEVKNDISPEVSQYLALVNGKREIWGDVPLNTNLCYSNPEVRSKVVNSIVEYLEEHNEIDLLHFWLADGCNNQCECDECVKMTPSDYYVVMLNELDEILTRKGINTKIVFLIYFELLFPPELKKINNQDRYIIMFAPITRTYSDSFTLEGIPDSVPKYVRNQLKFPSSIGENIAYLNAWKKDFKGDSFDFDYHFMWDHYLDPGQFETARILSEDIKKLDSIGLNGFISCQVHRCFFPNGLGMTVLGRTLWDKTLDYEKIAEEYFGQAYGNDGHKVMNYLKEISRRFNPSFIREMMESEEMSKSYAEIEDFVKSFAPVIKANLNHEDKAKAKSWYYLDIHMDYCIHYSKLLEKRMKGDIEGTYEKWDQFKAFIFANEDNIQKVFDPYELLQTYEVMTNKLLVNNKVPLF